MNGDGEVRGDRGGMVARTFSSLRTRNFRLFFIGQLVSNSGNWLTTVAITLLILRRTNSGADVGLLSACQFGPILLLSAWAGLVADRSNKRHLLYVTQTLEMVQSFVLAVLAFMHQAPLWAFFVTALAGGVLLAFDNPGRRSFVNEMVGQRDVTNAVTLYSAMANLSRIVGPAVGGLLIVAFGYGWCFTVDGVSYVVVLVALVMMRAAELHTAPKTPRGRGQIRDGFRYVRSTPVLAVSFLMLLIVGTASYNFTVTFPLFVEKGLHGSATDYTLVYSIFSAGAVIGTLLVARREAVGFASIVRGAALFGVALVALAAVPGVGLAYPAAALVGGTSVAYMTATTALAQLQADRQMVGRVLALQTVLQVGTTPVGGPILGVISDAAGGRTPMYIGGVAAMAAAAVGLIASRRWKRRAGLPGGTARRYSPCVPNADFSDVLEANAAFAKSFVFNGLQARAAKGLAVLTCMDSRLDPLRMLGLVPGDAKILRNAGARVTEDVLRTVVLARYLLGAERFMVVAHTGCKMASGSEAAVHEAISAGGGPDTRSLSFLTTEDQKASLREDVQRVRSSPYLSDVTVGGFLYNLHTGVLEEVC